MFLNPLMHIDNYTHTYIYTYTISKLSPGILYPRRHASKQTQAMQIFPRHAHATPSAITISMHVPLVNVANKSQRTRRKRDAWNYRMGVFFPSSVLSLLTHKYLTSLSVFARGDEYCSHGSPMAILRNLRTCAFYFAVWKSMSEQGRFVLRLSVAATGGDKCVRTEDRWR